MKKTVIDVLYRMLPQNWNDFLALVILAGILVLVRIGVADTNWSTTLRDAFIFVVYYYFRKQPPKET